MESASTSDTKTSIVIPKAVLHDHPYFSFSEVPKQDGDHQYGSHCVVEFTNFNKSAQFGDGMTPNMMITSVPPASIFEGDSDPDSSDDPHQNLVQLTKADLTRASHMPRDPSLRTSQRENKGKTSKYKDEEVDLFNNRRKTPQKKSVLTKDKTQPKTPKSPPSTEQDDNKIVKGAKKIANKGKKASKKADIQEEIPTVVDESKQAEESPLIEEADRNGDQEPEEPKTPSKPTPGKRGRKPSNKAKVAEKTEAEPETPSEEPEKTEQAKEASPSPAKPNSTARKGKAEKQKTPAPGRRTTRGKGKQEESEAEKEVKEEEEVQDEPPVKKRRGPAKKNQVKEEEQPSEVPATPEKGKKETKKGAKSPAAAAAGTRRSKRNTEAASEDIKTEDTTEPEEDKQEKPAQKTPVKKESEPKPRGRGRKKKKPDEEQEELKEEEAPVTFTPCDVAAAAGDPWGQAVPMELLVKIFIIVKQETGLLPFVSKVSQVCKLWYEATKHPNLWHKVDLSNDSIKKYKKSFQWLCKNRLEQTVALNLSGWEGLRHADVQILTNNAKALESLDLSGCNKLCFENLQLIVDKMEKLHTISLAKTWAQLVQNKSLTYITEKKAAQLKKLDLSENSLVKFETSLQSLMKHCPNLEVLNLNKCMFSNQMLNLPLTKLQNSCPKLRVFLFSQSLFKIAESTAKERNECEGFQNLEYLNISRSTAGRIGKFKHVTDEILARFVKNAEGLRVLDVSGCLHITAKGLGNLPAKALEKLYMSQCKAASQHEFLTVLLNWSNSLKEIDLSGNSMEPAHLKQILETCSSLTYIDVNGCRGLPWAMRKGYSGQELKGLMAELNSIIKESGSE